MHPVTKALLPIATLGVLAGVAYAARGQDNDAIAATPAKVALAQAATTAEQHAGGHATRAQYEPGKPGVYEVEVVKGTQVFDVRVDADQGTVIASVEDKADAHGRKEHDDEEDDDDEQDDDRTSGSRR